MRITVNNLFLLVLGLYCYLGYGREALVVFVALLLHEAGHISVARGYELGVEEIELLPFGGVAKLGDLIELNPVAEFCVALAGPINSLIMAGIGRLLLDYGLLKGNLTEVFITANLTLGLFNLLPALPMDGGRMLRAQAARKLGYKHATERSVYLSRILAILLLIGTFAATAMGRVVLPGFLVPVFIWLGAEKELRGAAAVLVRYMLRKKGELRSSGIIPIEHLLVDEKVPIKLVAKHLVPKKYRVFLVADSEFNVVGEVNEMQLIEAMMQRDINMPIGELRNQPPDGKR